MNGKNFNDDERGLLPFPVILAATKGDPDAMKVVLQKISDFAIDINQNQHAGDHYRLDKEKL